MLAIYFAVGALAAECNAGSSNCENNQCETVGGTEICTQCNANYVPINGKCAAATNSNTKCQKADTEEAGDQTCGKCLSTTFMYKGGCYDGDSTLGQVICKTIGGEAGKCETCADGYFKNSNASPTSDSCSECDPTCLTCSAAGDSKCKSCKDGYFLGAAGNGPGKCVSCGTVQSAWSGVANCAKCNKPVNENTPAVCTECAEGYYLRTAADGTTTSCVADCGEGFFAATINSIKKCARCNDNTNGGIADCGESSLFPYK